ncbi:hypothetical protein [Changchengzhania lutea]|uniref:hypothetical protein n=1 Tax=Changchengzhania lutea TaxID=2049305 RepID=UPI00115D830B|nr:hypothetical protein [Changchengzhania lutea]
MTNIKNKPKLTETLTHYIPINIALTDSLSLKIPLDSCNVIDDRLLSATYIVYEATGEVERITLDNGEFQDVKHPPKPIIISKNGITVRISVSEIPIYNEETQKKVPTRFINLTVSSKLLKHNYFQGITKDTVMNLYNEFMYFNVFRCSYDVFLDGYASDIDICINHYVDSPQIFHQVLKYLVTMSGDKSKYAHLISEGENLGLSFNKRNYAKPSLPFLKLYFKHWELISKSAEFYNTYLFDDYAHKISNLARIEATIKNYDHKRRLEKFKIFPRFKTLREYLLIPQEDLRRFVVFSLTTYIEKQPRLRAPNLSPTDHIIFELIQNCIRSGHDLTTLLSIVESFEGSSMETQKVQRSRMRKKIKELFNLNTSKDLELQQKVYENEKVNEYLKQLGL